MNVTLTPHALSGTVLAPASKSYAHRYLLAAYLAGGSCRVCHVGTSRDVEATLGVLAHLGLRYHPIGDDVLIEGVTRPACALAYCRESGSTLRFMLPVAAALGIHTTFTAEAGLLARPIGDLVDALNAHGAAIDGLTVCGTLESGDYVISGGVSSQYITGLLFALPLLDGDSRILIEGELVSRSYIDVTLEVLAAAGICVREFEGGFAVPGNQTYRLPPVVNVEGDWSGAAFMLAAGALGDSVTVANLDINSTQGDRAMLDVLRRFGAEVHVTSAGVTVRHAPLIGADVDLADTPDLAQVIAVLAAYAEGETVLHSVDRLRVKESNRLSAIMDMLTRAGVKCRYAADTLIIEGGRPRGADFTGGGDHRTVMSACILAAFAEGRSTVTDAESVDKSYPAFFADFAALGGVIDGNL
jgi:3-phosphoshikimate 1-carboxyvinyltransferase